MATLESDSSNSVKLYAYDLSNGLARTMSMAWTGRQFDAIWHTSVVFDGQVEVFFGQGITTCLPGQSQHGRPIKIIDYGTTMIDLGTFMEYIDGLRQSWTASSYHLLERNCNHFSNEVISFLNGRSVPDEILNLPQHFLATPLGASMRPMIDQMFREPPQLPSRLTSSVPTPANLLTNVANSAYNSSTEAPSVKPCTTIGALDEELSQHVCAVVNFTNERGCPPCRVIAPVYEKLANHHRNVLLQGTHIQPKKSKSKDIVFLKVDTTTSLELSRKYAVQATPTFKFFLKGKLVDELKGANPSELETQINLLLFSAYPPHPHLQLKFRKLGELSSEPIRYPQSINLAKALEKLLAPPSVSVCNHSDIIATLRDIAVPFLDRQADLNDPARFQRWISATQTLLKELPTSESFPALDFLRLALIRPEFIDQVLITKPNPIYEIFEICVAKLSEEEKDRAPGRPFLLTLLRFVSNSLSSAVLSEQLLEIERCKGAMLKLLVGRLLDGDPDVKISSSGVCYGLICRWSADRVEYIVNSSTDDQDEEWEVEMISALIESLRRAQESDESLEIIHRLSASIGKLYYLSGSYLTLKALIESLALDGIIGMFLRRNDNSDGGKFADIAQISEDLKKLINS